MTIQDFIDKLSLFDPETEIVILSFNHSESHFELDDPTLHNIDKWIKDLFSFPEDSVDKLLIF